LGVSIAVSILNADLSELGRLCQEVEAAGAQSFQVDVMDGHFVPELSFGPEVAATVVRHTSLPVEAHLMVEQPDHFIDRFAQAGCRDFIFHTEVVDDVPAMVARVRAAGMRVGVAIKMTTPYERLLPHLDLISLIVVMSIEPGRGGQPFDAGCLPTLRALREQIQRRGLPTHLQIDGGINAQTAPLAVDAGADTLIAGSYLFRHPGGYREAIAALRPSPPSIT
jgi:ribulose-phosphate 3-epimerase